MLIDLNNYEIYDLLKNGSTNQKNFIDGLDVDEFDEFIDFLESDDEFKDFDLRGLLNGGVLKVIECDDEDEDEDAYVLMSFDDKKIILE